MYNTNIYSTIKKRGGLMVKDYQKRATENYLKDKKRITSIFTTEQFNKIQHEAEKENMTAGQLLKNIVLKYLENK